MFDLFGLYGFNTTFLICAGGFIGGITSLCSGFAPTWQTLAVTRFLTGIFVGGSGVIMFVTLTELLGKRAWAAAGKNFFQLVKFCSVTCVAYPDSIWYW